MRIFIIIAIVFVVLWCWMVFAALQEDEKVLTQEELEELANALWESDDDNN